MVRWLRSGALVVLAIALVGLGIATGLFLVANARWVSLVVPDWFQGLVGHSEVEIWAPVLLVGWLVGIFAVAGLIPLSFLVLWRRRQNERTIKRLEQELSRLRNLAFTAPAPLEDLPDSQEPERADDEPET